VQLHHRQLAIDICKIDTIVNAYPLATEFQDDVNIIVIIEEAMKTNNMSVIQGLVNCNLLCHFLSLITFCHQ